MFSRLQPQLRVRPGQHLQGRAAAGARNLPEGQKEDRQRREDLHQLRRHLAADDL